jgi:hypothetical protein
LIEVIGGGEYALGDVQIRGGEKGATSAEKRHV